MLVRVHPRIYPLSSGTQVMMMAVFTCQWSYTVELLGLCSVHVGHWRFEFVTICLQDGHSVQWLYLSNTIEWKIILKCHLHTIIMLLQMDLLAFLSLISSYLVWGAGLQDFQNVPLFKSRSLEMPLTSLEQGSRARTHGFAERLLSFFFCFSLGLLLFCFRPWTSANFFIHFE